MTTPEPLTGEEINSLAEDMKIVFRKEPKGKQTIRKLKRGIHRKFYKQDPFGLGCHSGKTCCSLMILELCTLK